MNKLTPIFIAGALAVSVDLTIAQSQMNENSTTHGHAMTGHTMPASDNPAPQA